MEKPAVNSIPKETVSLHSIPVVNRILKTPFYSQVTRAEYSEIRQHWHRFYQKLIPSFLARSQLITAPTSLTPPSGSAGVQGSDTRAEKGGEPTPKASFCLLSSCTTHTFIPLLISHAINSHTARTFLVRELQSTQKWTSMLIRSVFAPDFLTQSLWERKFKSTTEAVWPLPVKQHSLNSKYL